jgi:benzoyl-CoA reductase/2-hydroxyglutaryl-CoA dehydratase subunit BcrC/BadD/HgdB
MQSAIDIAPILADGCYAARAAKARGQPVVGFLSNNVPVELIHAAGAFPLRLPTPPLTAAPLADRYLEPSFDPFARVALERLLRRDFAWLDLLVLPRSVDSFQRLYYYLDELRRSFGAALPEVYLYDVLHTPTQSSAAYDFESTLDLAAKLAVLSGSSASTDAYAAAIALYNRIRAKLATLLARRYQRPCSMSGLRAFELLAVAQRMAPADFEAVLSAALAQPAESAPGARTILIGSAHDGPALHRVVARAGGQVIADHHVLGDGLFGPAIDEAQPPLAAIAQHYHRHSWSVRSARAPLALGELARRTQAEAAVFFYYAQEEALTWHSAAQRRELDALGLPALTLPRQAYSPEPADERLLREFFAQQQRGLAP